MSTQKSKDLTWLFGLFFLIGLVLIFSDSTSSKKSGSQHSPSQSRFEQEDPRKLQIVNRHLKETALNLEQDKLKQKQEAQQVLDQYRNTQKQSSHIPTNTFTFDSDSNMQQLTSDLNRSVELDDAELTPEQIIHNELLKKQIMSQENRAYKEAYMQQFVENARAGGWEIKLGPDLEVISVKKIKPRNPSLLNQ